MECGPFTPLRCVPLPFDEDAVHVFEAYSSVPAVFVSLLITARLSLLENRLSCHKSLTEHREALDTSRTDLTFEDGWTLV